MLSWNATSVIDQERTRLCLPHVIVEPGEARAKLLLLGDTLAVMKRLPGVGIPVLPNTVVLTAGLGECLWLRPNQRLLVLSPPGRASRIAGEIRATNAPDAWVLDAGARYVEFKVSGPGAAAVLNAGCSLDLREAAFPVETCAQSRFDQIPVLLFRYSPERFEIFAERPLARHLWLWLCRAANHI